MKSQSIKIFRWTLRILSGIFVLFTLFMFLGETLFQNGSLNPKPLSLHDVIQLSMMGIILVGLVLAWKWELWGGIFALAAYIVLAFINPRTLQPSLLLLYPVSAILFIVLWTVSRNAGVTK